MYYDDIKELLMNPSDRTTEKGRSPSSWLAAGAAFGLAGGLITGIVGSLLTFTSWLTWVGTLKQYEHWLGTALLVATIPLMAVGAHFLDLIDGRKSQDSS
ncbi:MAG: hypothetical protein DMF69_13560 [Acidobacteria bacterium]|nr:MAG: hypothetical protein DMF69_13560 [Acidobacteriota bacterium]